MAELSSNWKRLQAIIKSDKSVFNSASQQKDIEAGPLHDGKAKRLKTTTSTGGTALQPLKTQKRSRSPPTTQIRSRSSSQARSMGGVHSSQKLPGLYPSLSLWAEDNDISTEDLAEAYGLGLGRDSLEATRAKDKVNHGLIEGVQVGKFVAIDCEMVGVGLGGHESALARVSLVDFHGRQVYDSYVKPQEMVTDWRTAVSGISPKELRFARGFPEVQQQVYAIIKDRILVGHDISHDLDALKLSHPLRDIRDTAKYPGFKKFGNGRKPSLRVLGQELLGVEIHNGPHSSIEDARVTMLLFRKHKSGFEMDHANRFAARPSRSMSKTGKKKPRKKI